MRINLIPGIKRTLAALALAAVVGGCGPSKGSDDLKAGYTALDQREYEAALDKADHYLQENPAGNGAASAMYLRGRALEQRTKRTDAESDSNLREARAAYEKALASNPGKRLDSYIRASLGNVCYWLGDYAAAERQWAAAFNELEEGDLKAWVLYRQGLCQQRLGKWSAADQTFVQVRQQWPGTVQAERSAAHEGWKAFYVQVAAFQSPATADKTVSQLQHQGFPVGRQTKGNLHLVLVGPARSYDNAVDLRTKILGQYHDAMIVP
jgi:tetratricopeptide (TPR) repeat protein